MEQKSLGDVPWGGVAVVAMFLASLSYDVQRPFEGMRSSGQEKSQQRHVVPGLEIDARLWEDPFAAYERFRSELQDRKSQNRLPDCGPAEELSAILSAAPATCAPQVGPASSQAASAASPTSAAPAVSDVSVVSTASAVSTVSTTPDGSVPRGEKPSAALVIGVLVPGDPFVGAQESRRRTRYALLSGLHAEGYVARDPGHMGALTVDLRTGDPACGKLQLDAQGDAGVIVPLDVLDPRSWTDGVADRRREIAPKYGRVGVLWINEAALIGSRLTRLRCLLLGTDADGHARSASQHESARDLVLIGPSSSDVLADLLRDMKTPFEGRHDPLAHVRILSLPRP